VVLGFVRKKISDKQWESIGRAAWFWAVRWIGDDRFARCRGYGKARILRPRGASNVEALAWLAVLSPGMNQIWDLFTDALNYQGVPFSISKLDFVFPDRHGDFSR